MRKFLSLLGLCKRAGKLAAGEVAAEQAVRGKQAYFLILSEDASKNTKKKFRNSAAYYELPLAEIGTKEELGRAIGTDSQPTRFQRNIVKQNNDPLGRDVIVGAQLQHRATGKIHKGLGLQQKQFLTVVSSLPV